AVRQGQASFDFSIGLIDWKYLESNAIAANLSVRQMPLAQLQELAKLNYPVTGNLSADLSLRGSQSNPVGNGSAQMRHAKRFGQQEGNPERPTVNRHRPDSAITGAAGERKRHEGTDECGKPSR